MSIYKTQLKQYDDRRGLGVCLKDSWLETVGATVNFIDNLPSTLDKAVSTGLSRFGVSNRRALLGAVLVGGASGNVGKPLARIGSGILTGVAKDTGMAIASAVIATVRQAYVGGKETWQGIAASDDVLARKGITEMSIGVLGTLAMFAGGAVYSKVSPVFEMPVIVSTGDRLAVAAVSSGAAVNDAVAVATAAMPALSCSVWGAAEETMPAYDTPAVVASNLNKIEMEAMLSERFGANVRIIDGPADLATVDAFPRKYVVVITQDGRIQKRVGDYLAATNGRGEHAMMVLDGERMVGAGLEQIDNGAGVIRFDGKSSHFPTGRKGLESVSASAQKRGITTANVNGLSAVKEYLNQLLGESYTIELKPFGINN